MEEREDPNRIMLASCDVEPYYDERERLAALDAYHILDTPREKDYDDIVELAAQICNAPMSVITLIAEGRQWFKAEKGLGVNQTPLDVSICKHAILQQELFEVPDTMNDARFARNPLVTGDPKLRFYTGAILKTPEGLPLGMLCVLDTKPRQLNEHQKFALQTLAKQVMSNLELKKSLEKYEQKNAELTHFSYAVSHDLRDPLASITSLMELFRMRYGQDLDARGHEMLSSVFNSTERLRKLIYNMLAFAEIDENGVTSETCDGEQVVATTLENLQAAIDSSGAKVTVGCLPQVGMGALELGQVLQNLVGNALNYRDRTRKPEIRISATQEAEKVRISVADNGIGIAPENVETIFAPLKRLHGDDRPGTGLGLSIIRKIVERRGGAVWAESRLGEGTTFTFTIPTGKKVA